MGRAGFQGLKVQASEVYPVRPQGMSFRELQLVVLLEETLLPYDLPLFESHSSIPSPTLMPALQSLPRIRFQNPSDLFPLPCRSFCGETTETPHILFLNQVYSLPATSPGHCRLLLPQFHTPLSSHRSVSTRLRPYWLFLAGFHPVLLYASIFIVNYPSSPSSAPLSRPLVAKKSRIS